MDASAARYMATAQIVAAALEKALIPLDGHSAAERGKQLGECANAVFRYLSAAATNQTKPDD